MGLAFQEAQQRFPYAQSQVFDAALAVLPMIGFKIGPVDRILGRIMAGSSMSVLSYGETLTIAVEPIDEVSSLVRIGSRLQVAFNVTGMSRNRWNIEKVIRALSSYLQTYGKTGQSLSTPPEYCAHYAARKLDTA